MGNFQGRTKYIDCPNYQNRGVAAVPPVPVSLSLLTSESIGTAIKRNIINVHKIFLVVFFEIFIPLFIFKISLKLVVSFKIIKFTLSEIILSYYSYFTQTLYKKSRETESKTSNINQRIKLNKKTHHCFFKFVESNENFFYRPLIGLRDSLEAGLE